MQQDITESHLTDAQGQPAGGHTQAIGLNVYWQDSPLAVDGVRHEPNGCFVETVIAAAIGRLAFYQASEFNCVENGRAILALEEALIELHARTADREARGVEGTHDV